MTTREFTLEAWDIAKLRAIERGASLVAVVGPPGPAGPPGAGGLVEREAGEVLGGHRAVRIGADDLAWYAEPADGDVAGITTGAASVGGTAHIVATGEVTEASWDWQPGPVYLGAGGTLTQAPPASGAIVIIGTALGPDAMFVGPRLVARL